MSRIAFLSGAALLASMLAAPAMAQRAVHPGHSYALTYCSHEAGNPYAPEEDYLAWSAWRARGGWDDRPDPNCVRRWYPRGPSY
jgi:hypothetical protein